MGQSRYTQQHYESKEYRIEAMRRFISKVRLMPSGCVEWQGPLYPKGYGMFSFAKKNYRAHRLSFMWANGVATLTADQFVCHSCDNPKCVNPEHLWLGDILSNTRDSHKKGRHCTQTWWPKRTHCIAGHEYTAENVRIDARGRRMCRACRAVSEKAHTLRRYAHTKAANDNQTKA